MSIEGKNIQIFTADGRPICFQRSPYDGQYGLALCRDPDLQPVLRFERDTFSGKYFLVDANRGGVYSWVFMGHNYPNRIVYTDDRKSTFPEQFLWERPRAGQIRDDVPQEGRFNWYAWDGSTPNQVQMNQGLIQMLEGNYPPSNWTFKFVPQQEAIAAGNRNAIARKLPKGSILISIPMC